MTASYSTGSVSNTSPGYYGGVVGFDQTAPGTFSAAYWDLTTSVSDPSHGAGNLANDPGIEGLTSSQLQSGLPSGFEFLDLGRERGHQWRLSLSHRQSAAMRERLTPRA